MEGRLIITIDRLTSGGAERQAVTLANYFADRGYRVVVINSDKDSLFYDVDKKVKVIKMGLDYSKNGIFFSIKRFIKKYFFLLKYFRIHRLDTVLTFLPNMEIPTIMAAKFYRMKIYATVSADPRTYTLLVRMFRMIMFPMIAGVVFQTEKVKNYKDYKNIKRCSVIKNPLTQEIGGLQVSVPAAQRKRVIFTAGRLEEVKNQAGLIRAFSKLSLDYSDVKLYIFGEGILHEKLLDVIHDLKAEKNIFLPGAESNAISRNRDALIFVLNSFSEGMPNALMEAMAYGIPVISTDFYTGAASELIQDGINGFLVPVNDEKRLEEKMRYILDHPDITEKVGCNATKIYECCNVARIGAEWEKFIFG